MRFLILALVALAACKHADATGTATIHSGTPEGPQVTTVALAVPEQNAIGDRLARAFCKHEQECALDEPETRLLEEDACFERARYAARASLARWQCEPSAANEGFSACLAAIREADCSARTGEGAVIPACRATEICRGAR